MARWGRRTFSNAFASPPWAAWRRRLSVSGTNPRLLLSRPHLARAVGRYAQSARGALQEQDGEAGVDRAVAPGAVRGLGLDEHLGALGIPLVRAHHLGAVEQAGAFEGVHVVQVLVLGVLRHLRVLVGAGVVRHGEVLGDPLDALVDVLVALPGLLLAVVVVLDVVPDGQRADRSGRHRAVGLVVRVVAVAPARGGRLPLHHARTGHRGARAARDAGHVLGVVRAVHATFDQVLLGTRGLLLAVADPLHRGVGHLAFDDDARVVAGAHAQRGILRVRVVVRIAVALLLDLDLVLHRGLVLRAARGRQLELLHAAFLAAARRDVLALRHLIGHVLDIDRGRAVAPEALGALVVDQELGAHQDALLILHALHFLEHHRLQRDAVRRLQLVGHHRVEEGL